MYIARDGLKLSTRPARRLRRLWRGTLLALHCVAGAIVPAASHAAIELQPVVTGLNGPVGITYASDGSGRLFITLQGGQIVIFDGSGVLPTPFLDVTDRVLTGGERGLLGLAFHPSYATNGFLYVFYTSKPIGDIVIARYTVSADPNVASHDPETILLTIPHSAFSSHNGGQLKFGPDGYLYASVGDGGGGGDPANNAQNLGALLGKLLRLDVDGGAPYVPAGNPFGNEIWALGLRNPWRFSFDRLTGDLFIGDVGQATREEVNFQPAGSAGGQNYCWRHLEGTLAFDGLPCSGPGTPTAPILEYSHSAGDCAITGGYRYRGSAVPSLVDLYLYADFCTGRIWGASLGAPGWTSTLLLDSPYNVTTFGEDPAGELYLAHYAASGTLYRIIEGVAVTAITPDLTSPRPAGTPITWTATATGGSGTYQYQFWRKAGSGGYTIVQPYGASASYTWTPGAPDVGDSQVAVWVRNAGSAAAVEAGGIAAVFTVTASVQVTALTPNLTSPRPAGTPVTWTATATGGSGTYQYQFWRRAGSGGYTIVQPYGASASYTWTPGAPDVGDSQVAVWVRNAGSAAAVEAGGIAAVFTITP